MNKFLNSILCRNVKYENINGPENANFFLDKSWKKQVQIKDENVKDDEDSDDEIEVVGMKTNNKTFFAVKDEVKEEEKKILRGLLFQTFLFLLKSHFYIEISTNKIINNDRDQSSKANGTQKDFKTSVADLVLICVTTIVTTTWRGHSAIIDSWSSGIRLTSSVNHFSKF